MQTRGLPGLLLVLPALLLLTTLTLYPVGYGFWLSLHAKHSLFPQQTFVGLDNYLYLLNDPEFWESLRIGLIYSVSTILLQLCSGWRRRCCSIKAFSAATSSAASCCFPT